MISFLLIVFFTGTYFAQSNVKDSLITIGINQIYNVKFEKADSTFKTLRDKFPNDPAGIFFLSMIDWWRILLNTTVEKYDDKFLEEIDLIIEKCDSILEKEPNNVDALFFKAGAIGFRGRLRALRFSWFKAADDGRKALPIVEKVMALEPNSNDAIFGLGLYNYYAAILPEKYPILKPIMIFMPSTNKDEGIRQVKRTAEKGRYAKYEAIYFLMLIYFTDENKPFVSYKYSKILTKDFPDNPIFEKWEGRIAAKIGNSLRASEIFKDVLLKGQKKMTGYTDDITKREASYYIADRYWKENKIDSSKIFFEQSLKYSKVIDKGKESGFYINALIYLGMINDVQNNREAAIEYYNRVLDLDKYKQSHQLAEKYLKNPYKK
ncbi:MAG TPA: hypothetical protein ENI57_03075 [Ignavibacteria bacterium]|nr:hypothetical protein [Ignavibacteria bacterium]